MENFTNFIKHFGLLIIPLVFPLASTYAQGDPATPGHAGTGNNFASGVPSAAITKVQGVLNILCLVFAWAFYFLIALAVLFVVIAGYRYLTASGEAEKVKSANNAILYAAIAVAVALLAKGIPLIVGDFLGSNNLGQLAAC